MKIILNWIFQKIKNIWQWIKKSFQIIKNIWQRIKNPFQKLLLDLA